MSSMIKSFIRDVPDFPKKGIIFKDLTPLLSDPVALQKTYEKLADKVKDLDFDLIVGTESRGFIFGVGLSRVTGKGFVPIRKKGKLPCATYSENYQLEYGTDTLEIHQDAIKRGQKVLLVDDLLATGGTMAASINLVGKCQGRVAGCAFVIELEFLYGRKRIEPNKVFSLAQY